MNTSLSSAPQAEGAALERPAMMPGFGNDFETEALPGALPQGRNSPQRAPYGLYAEQLSGSAFTAPRGQNQRSWLYRIRPTVRHVSRWSPVTLDSWVTAPAPWQVDWLPGQLRWDPIPLDAAADLTFLTGLATMTTAGDAHSGTGLAVHVLRMTQPMTDQGFLNADGEMMIVPEQGHVRITTEMGVLQVGPGEIAIVPRGMMMRADPVDGPVRGYVCENYGLPFTLPERGPIGANCLANPRDFKTPVAAFEDREDAHEITLKWGGRFFRSQVPHSPFDVVAWHGNYAPYQYDLRTYSPVGAIGFDHPDPSIFTVLTSPSANAGTANIDFVIFPERWMVAEDTFRPPWYHRNLMSEFMGLIYGVYDAKPGGFTPGGMSLHNCMLPHGPDGQAFSHASTEPMVPVKQSNTLAFMFESRLPQHPTRFAEACGTLQDGYTDCWAGLKKNFDPNRKDWDGR